MENPPLLIYTSTNKVYGALNDLSLAGELVRAIKPMDAATRTGSTNQFATAGFSQPVRLLEGSRGAVRFGLCYTPSESSALVFRMSCIYGLHQMGTEDQGWVSPPRL